jgi:hypothetical protein
MCGHGDDVEGCLVRAGRYAEAAAEVEPIKRKSGPIGDPDGLFGAEAVQRADYVCISMRDAQ